MKATGIVRKMDMLGRVVLPMELRKVLDINVDDPIEVFTHGENIVLKKYTPGCFFCDNADDLVSFGSRKVCRDCVAKLSQEAAKSR